MENYRLNGLTRRSQEIIEELKEGGLMSCDIEVIGALLFTKYKGSDKRISDLLEGSSKLLQEAEELLERLKNKV